MSPAHSGAYGRLPGYPLAGIPEIRRRLAAEGVDLIDLGAGDADLDPPPAVVEALRQAAGNRSMSRYAFQLAQRFHRFYDRYRVVGQPDDPRRLLRASTIALYLRRMGEVLELMGIDIPDRM